MEQLMPQHREVWLLNQLKKRCLRNNNAWHGTCRDLEEIRECGYPVWAKGVCPRRSRNDFTFGTINEPIVVTGIKIKKDDIIVADQSGVVCVPEEVIQETLDLLKKIFIQEELLEDQVLKNQVQNWDEL